MLYENGRDLLDFERARGVHFFEVGPILRPIEESFENRDVATRQERDFSSTEVFLAAAAECLVVVGSGIEKHIDRRPIPSQPRLAIAFESGELGLTATHSARQSCDDIAAPRGIDENIDVDVDGPACTLGAPGQR